MHILTKVWLFYETYAIIKLMDGHDNGADGTANNLDKSNTGGASGGIFSTPDLTVNTENLPQNQPAKPASAAPRFNFGRRANRGNTSAESSERVASAFAQTDASQQAERLSDAMLESANATTRSTATGDIQLDVPKKKKRWPWAVGAGVVVVAVVGIVAWFMLIANSSQDIADDRLKKSFNEFANFLLYAQESDNDIEGLYQYGDEYAIGNMTNSEEIGEHFKKSEEKFREFSSLFNSEIETNPEAFSDDIQFIVENYLPNLDLFWHWKERPLVGTENLLEVFFSSNDSTYTTAATYFEPYAQSPVEQTRLFINSYLERVKELLNAFQIFESFGCANAEAIQLDMACVANVDDPAAIAANESIVIYNEFLDEAINDYGTISISVFEDIWKIKGEIK